jgi:predicted DNA binding protein
MQKIQPIRAKTKYLHSAEYGDGMLTPRQIEVMIAAINVGYFEFPRKISLTKLVKRLSTRPSTAAEILRRAENKRSSEN